LRIDRSRELHPHRPQNREDCENGQHRKLEQDNPVRQAQLASPPGRKGLRHGEEQGREENGDCPATRSGERAARAKTGDEYGHGRDENYEVVVPGNRGENWQECHEHGVFEIEGDGAGGAGFARNGIEQKAEERYETNLGEDGRHASERGDTRKDGE